MTEMIGVAIGIGVLALVFIYLGCLMWKKEKITLLHSIIMIKCLQVIKRFFVKYQVGVLSLLELVLFYRFCIGICCGISVADLCRSKI